MAQNRSKPWAIPMLFAQKWPEMTVFESFINYSHFPKGVKMAQNRSKPWAIPMLFAPKWPKMTVFESYINYSHFSKRCENGPKSIKTMGYSPCFLLKNGQK